MALTTCQQDRTLLDRVLYQGHDAGRCPTVDQRTQNSFAWEPRPKAQHFALQPCSKVVSNMLIDDQTFSGHADLTLVEVGAESRCFHGLIQVGVIQHHERGFATQLQYSRFQVACRQLANDFSHMRGASEVDTTHRRVGDQTLDDGRSILRGVADDIDHAITESGLLQHLTNQRVNGRTVLGSLQHHGVAAGQRHGNRSGS
ncbi:hypothetical protein D9M70_532580 [compost metagenome]